MHMMRFLSWKWNPDLILHCCRFFRDTSQSLCILNRIKTTHGSVHRLGLGISCAICTTPPHTGTQLTVWACKHSHSSTSKSINQNRTSLKTCSWEHILSSSNVHHKNTFTCPGTWRPPSCCVAPCHEWMMFLICLSGLWGHHLQMGNSCSVFLQMASRAQHSPTFEHLDNHSAKCEDAPHKCEEATPVPESKCSLLVCMATKKNAGLEDNTGHSGVSNNSAHPTRCYKNKEEIMCSFFLLIEQARTNLQLPSFPQVIRNQQ